jgi:hypothetical protein
MAEVQPRVLGVGCVLLLVDCSHLWLSGGWLLSVFIAFSPTGNYCLV